MSWRAFAVALALPVLFVASTMAAVWVNRQAPGAPVVLTERELTVDAGDEGNSGVTVWITWAPEREGPQRWLAPARLAALGFDTSVPADAAEADRFYARQLPRYASVAFEFREVRGTRSRLVPVDADADGDALRARYPDSRRHLIVPGIVAICRAIPPGGAPYVDVSLVNIEPRGIHVPTELAGRLPAISRRERPAPFRVTLRYGRRGEPWIDAIE